MTASNIFSFKIEDEQLIVTERNLEPDFPSSNQSQNTNQPSWVDNILESAENSTNKEWYREENKNNIKKKESERKTRIQCLKNIAEYCRAELNEEDMIDTNFHSSSDLDETQESIHESEQTSLSGFSSFIEENTTGSEHTSYIGPLDASEESSRQGETTKKKDALLKLQRKRLRQQRYREQNREKLKKREAERRKRKQCLQNIAAYLKVELNDDDKSEILNLEGSQISYVERRKESKLEKNRERQKRYRERKKEKLKQMEAECLQSPEVVAELLRENNKKREWQKRYREKNREKLKEREKERRKHVHCLQRIAQICSLELHDHGVLDSNHQSSLGSEQSGLEQFAEFGIEHFAFNFGMDKILTHPPDNIDPTKCNIVPTET